jgi:hypothetical protein
LAGWARNDQASGREASRLRVFSIWINEPSSKAVGDPGPNEALMLFFRK